VLYSCVVFVCCIRVLYSCVVLVLYSFCIRNILRMYDIRQEVFRYPSQLTGETCSVNLFVKDCVCAPTSFPHCVFVTICFPHCVFVTI